MRTFLKKMITIMLAAILFAELPMGEITRTKAALYTGEDASDDKRSIQAETAKAQPVVTEDGQYVSALRLFKSDESKRAKTVAQAEADGWHIAKDGDNAFNLNEFTGRDDILLGYKTSTNSDDAITDMRMLEMGHGYEWFDYQKIAESQMDKLDVVAADIGVAAVEFANNLKNGSKAAEYAKEYLNFLYFTENFETGNKKSERKSLGDYLSSGNVDQNMIKKMVIRMNGGSLTALYSQLALAVSDSDKTWVERISETEVYTKTDITSTEAKIRDRAYYEYAVELSGVLNLFADGYRSAQSHKNGGDVALPSVSGSSVDSELDEDNVQEVIDAGNNDKNSPDLLYEAAYGILGKYKVGDESAAEYMLRLGEKTYSTKSDYRALYPLVAALTDGQYGMMKIIGFAQMVLNMDRTDEFYSNLEDMKSEVLSRINTVNPGDTQMSIWTGVNTEFYERTVALTEDAYRESKAGTLYTELTREGDFYDNVIMAMTYIGLASSVCSLITGCVKLGIMIAGAKLSVWAVCAGAIGGGVFSTLGGILGCVAVIGGYVAIVALIIVGITYFVKWLVDQFKDPDREDYLQMPDEIYDLAQIQKDGEDKTAYIKYEVVCNSSDKAQDLNADDGKRWNLLYYTKNKDVGSPLMADDTGRVFVRTVDDITPPAGAVSVKGFGEKSAANINSYTRKKGANAIYLHFATRNSLEKSGGEIGSDDSVNEGGTIPATDAIDESCYLFGLMISHESSESAAKAAITRKQGYRVFDVNLAGEDGYTYIGFATTKVEKDAIRDIRVVPYGSGETNYGAAGYASAGSLDDKTTVVYTKYESAGNPVYAGFLSQNELLTPESGYEPVNMFCGGNAYDLNFQTENKAPVYLYFKSTVSYTSGEKYVGGIQYVSVRKGAETKDVDAFIRDMGLIDYGVEITDHRIASNTDKHGYTSKGRTVMRITTGTYNYDDYKIRLCYTYTYNPYRAIYDVAAFTATTRVDSLQQMISGKKGVYTVAENILYSDVACLYANAGDSSKSEKYASKEAIGMISRNHSYINPPKTVNPSVTQKTRIEDNISWSESPTRLRSLYLLGPVPEMEPLKVTDVVVSSNDGGVNGMHPVRRFSDPYSEPVDISYADDKQQQGVYMYLKGDDVEKPKYISSIEVVSYKRPDSTEKHTFTEEEYELYDEYSDDQCLMSLAAKADGGIYNYNLAIPQGEAWYNDIGAKNNKATYIGVNRTNTESQAITGIIMLKASEKPDAKIRVGGAEYHRTGDPVNGYYIYYTKSPGAYPGLPLKDLSFSSEPIEKGMTTAVSISSPDDGQKTATYIEETPFPDLFLHMKAETDEAVISDMVLYTVKNKSELLNRMAKNGYNYVVNTSLNYNTGGVPMYLAYKMCSADAINSAKDTESDTQSSSDLGEDEDWGDFDFGFDDLDIEYENVIRDIVCVVGGTPKRSIIHNGVTYYLVTDKPFGTAVDEGSEDEKDDDSLDEYSLNAGTTGRTIYLYATADETVTIDGKQIKLSPLSGVVACSGNAVPAKEDKSNTYGTWEELLDTTSQIVDVNDSVINKFDDFSHARDCRLYLFTHRYDQSVKPQAQIKRGEVKADFTQGNLYLCE